MCGIAGILGRTDDRNRAALDRMGAALGHRGPDGGGVWVSPPDAAGNGALMLHRRLSILDLSECAAQPMVDPTTGHAVLFNGEIYNYALLREQLHAAGQQLQSTGDTAVALRWLAMGRPVEQLRGMYAIALWDPAARRMTFARDPHGIKPLYYVRAADVGGDGWSLAFASEVRALLASGLIPQPRMDPVAVASVVWNGFVVGPHTIVRHVRAMVPGSTMVVDAAGGIVQPEQRFWHLPVGREQTSTPATLSATLGETVAAHLFSDVPLAVFLSAGVDSSAVANQAQHHSPAGPIDSFTLAFEDAELNEGEPARAIAAAIGTNHHEVLLTERSFLDALDAACDGLDQPSFDGINTFMMSRAIREAGIKVAMVGTGGDELFGGYRSFREVPRMLAMAARGRYVPAGLKQLAARVVAGVKGGRTTGPVPPQTRWAKLPAMVAAGEDALALYQLAYAIFLPGFQRELLADGVDPLPIGLPPEFAADLIGETAGGSPLQQVSGFEQRLFLGERLLRDADATSMANSLEMRLPLVDSVLTEHVAGLPDGLRYNPVGRKQALRDAGLTGLPPALFERPKSGFVLPFDRWIRAGLGRSMDELMRDGNAAAAVGLNPAAVARLWTAYQAGGPGLYWSRVWAIYTLIRFGQRYGLSV